MSKAFCSGFNFRRHCLQRVTHKYSLEGISIYYARNWNAGIKSILFFYFLYFVDSASRYNFLLMTNLTHFFISLFITPLYMFRASQCPSSGDRIVLIHHLVWLVCVSDCLVCLTGIPSSHSRRLIIPDDVLIQFDLLMMGTVMLETCRQV